MLIHIPFEVLLLGDGAKSKRLAALLEILHIVNVFVYESIVGLAYSNRAHGVAQGFESVAV